MYCIRTHFNVRQVLQSITEDDDIVAGPQKMSLKCPVRNISALHDPVDAFLVEFCPHCSTNSVVEMCTFSMFRRYIVVFGHGTNYNVALSCL